MLSLKTRISAQNALINYEAVSQQLKALAYEFLNALDSDQDGRVSLVEFLAFMTQQGYTRFNNPYWFKELVWDGNGSLDFWEVLTPYYIVKSGRPLCNCCGILIPGTFFSCVKCFESSSSYSLCIHCYRSNRTKHHHNGRQQFLDTFTLLEMKKNSAIRGKANQNELFTCCSQQFGIQQVSTWFQQQQHHEHINVGHPTTWPSTSQFMAPAAAASHIHINVGPPTTTTPHTSNAIVPAAKNVSDLFLFTPPSIFGIK
ncbi:Calcium-binding EF-hand family protein [Abeliophyllum distichum]|uniref:Calcium-binding EF-hand family protein n=1 Tax=Abeliophyllum distichum TaxID=126358 RepID=A0ABD1NSU9_9LAMI